MTSSVALVTLVVSGTFSVLPNRTIAIDRPTIDPSIVPVPVKSEFIPTSTAGPFLVAPTPEHHLNNKLRIGLLAGLLGPLVLCIAITLFVRYRTAVLAKHHDINFSFLFTWRDLTPAVTPPGMNPANPVLHVPSTGQPSTYQTAKGKGKMPRFSLSRTNVPSNVGTRLNKKGQVEYFCTNHDCPIDPKTWRCQQSGDEVDPQFRSTKKPNVTSGSGYGAGPSMSQVR